MGDDRGRVIVEQDHGLHDRPDDRANRSESDLTVTDARRPMPLVPISRRTLIRGSGLAAAALAGLTSCTTYGSAQSSSSSGPAASGGTSGLTAKAADIPIGSGKVFPAAETVITQPTKGEFKAFTAICTHQQCTVADVTTTINCNCHGSRFSITDGSVVNPPAPAPLAAKPLTVKQDTIRVP
jgi:Rieske Fe-S protein